MPKRGGLGWGGDSWKEEVLLHDGQKIIVKRSQTYGGQHEIGQSEPIKEHTISFILPNSNKAITWTSEYGEDIGRTNFNLLALHILNGTPYIVADPNLCLSYNKWGRPNPPYVFFKYDDKEWKRIQISEFPAEFKSFNVVINLNAQHVKEMVHKGMIDTETIQKWNNDLLRNYPQYKTILREPYAGAEGGCIKTDYYGKAGWLSPDWFTDQPSLDACLKFCDHKKIGDEICPCNSVFKGAK
ncbi:MAG: hypothetical protein HY272_02825 [Gammaproteobacteria bacterium]|nr:hypothetical protein [Gammaproteobacteria bacterium]